MSRIDLFVTGFGRPDLLREQHRLLGKWLMDPYSLSVFDNTPEPDAAARMAQTCDELGIPYHRVQSETHEHPEALNAAVRVAMAAGSEYFGFLDHDCFPACPVTLIDKIDVAGCYGLGQTYSPRVGEPLRYLWPGWAFFSRSWLSDRVPDFSGIRGEHKFDDGDAGSLLHPLFADADWEAMAAVEHGYQMLREEDGHGLQSYGLETMSGWIHFTNGSHWKAVPHPVGRDRLIREMLAAL